MCSPLGLAGKAMGKVSPVMAGGLLGTLAARKRGRTQPKSGAATMVEQNGVQAANA